MPAPPRPADATTALALDLLENQGWPTLRPPAGRVVRRGEIRAFPVLAGLFQDRPPGGDAPGYPDLIGVSPEPLRPRLVIAARARAEQIDLALALACACAEEALAAGHPTLAVGVAGHERGELAVRVRKRVGGSWQDLRHRGQPVDWIPGPEDTEALLASEDRQDLAPAVPPAPVLAHRAELLNRLLRESKVKDEYRPACIGAMMLALWPSKGALRKDPRFVLRDVNAACGDAFAAAGKPELARSLRLPEENEKLAADAWELIATLEKLNVASPALAHDYLGQLYETFFRYTGGNTIGQYFTPRHVTRLMADLCQVAPGDRVIDPACGTGGFLVAALARKLEATPGTHAQAVAAVREELLGYESEPITAALAVANMILRGDGRSGIHSCDCFTAPDFPPGTCDERWRFSYGRKLTPARIAEFPLPDRPELLAWTAERLARLARQVEGVVALYDG